MTGSHLGATLLAEYDEGILPARAAADVAAHLAHCPLCSETHRQLAEVTVRLASAPAALPMPEDLAARVDRALAGEQPNRSNNRDGKIAPIRPLRARLPSVLAAAAVVGAVAFAGYVVGTGSGADDAGDQATSAESDADESVGSAPESESDVAGGAAAPTFQGTEPLPQSARTSLTEQIQAIAALRRTSALSGADREFSVGTCGAALATEVDRGLIGAAPTDLGEPGAVLVVTAASTPDAAQGWVLPACDATASDAISMLTVPLE